LEEKAAEVQQPISITPNYLLTRTFFQEPSPFMCKLSFHAPTLYVCIKQAREVPRGFFSMRKKEDFVGRNLQISRALRGVCAVSRLGKRKISETKTVPWRSALNNDNRSDAFVLFQA
jgi:hypothetical protein